MPLIVNTNIASMTAQRALTANNLKLNKSLEKLATGFRINRAGDDAAGLQISEGLRSQIRGNQKALDNVQDGLGLLNIVDGALSNITDLLQRMRELAVSAANDTLGSTQRNAIEDEMDQLATEITRISDSTKYNGRGLLDGTFTATSASYRIMIGSTSSSSQSTLDIASNSSLSDIDATVLQVDDANINVDSNANALTALDKLDTAIASVNSRRASLGAYMYRLENIAQSLMINIENQSAAESRIRNVDIASESAKLTSSQILQQASASILAQANQAPQIALQLLQQ